MAQRLKLLTIDGSGVRAPVVNATSIEAHDEFIDGEGTASFSILNIDAGRALVAPYTTVTVTSDENEAWWGSIEDLNQDTYMEGEEAAQVTKLTCVGIADELNRSGVMPSTGIDRLPYSDIRYLDWSCPEYDESSWAAAIGRFFWCNDRAAPEGLWGAPDCWPDDHGAWIAPTAWDGSPTFSDPIGDWFARKRFTTSTATELVIYCAADDGFDLRLDGVPILNYTAYPGVDGWNKGRWVRLRVSAGPHVLACRVSNWDRTDSNGTNNGNASTLIVAVYAMFPTLAYGTVQVMLSYPDSGIDPSTGANYVLRSDNTWKVSPVSAGIPGLNAPQIGTILMSEGASNGEIVGWTRMWSGTTDSRGAACPIIPDAQFQVGMSVLDAFKQMAEGYIEYNADIQPGGATRRLYMWDITSAAGRGATQLFSVLPGVNATTIQHTTSTKGHTTKLLVRSKTGYQVYTSSHDGPVDAGFLSLSEFGTPNDSGPVSERAYKYLTRSANTPTSVTATYFPPTAADSAPAAFSTGDSITCVNMSSTPTVLRVKAIGYSEPEEGKLLITPVLDTAEQTRDRQIERWLKRFAKGTVDGRSEAATPYTRYDVKTGDIDLKEFTWEQSGDVFTSEGNSWLIGTLPIKVMRWRLHADAATGTFSQLSTVVLKRNNVVVATQSLHGDDKDDVQCLFGLYGAVNDNWNVEVTLAGPHERLSVSAECLLIN